jgi:hypothetical protein
MKIWLTGYVVIAASVLLSPATLGAQQTLAGEAPAHASVLVRPPPAFASAEPPRLPAIGVAAEVRFDPAPGGVHGFGGAVVRSPRPWWLYPAVGAGIGVVTLGGLAYYQCSQRDCTMDLFAFVVPGALVGAAVGGFFAVLTRPAPPPPVAPGS